MSLLEYKQVIIIRKDIHMSVGKIAAQVAHAAVTAAIYTQNNKREWFEKWFAEGQKKVILKVESKDELINLWNIVKSEIPSVLIHDRGLTELPPGTLTALGIGPAPEQLVDKHTRSLPLL